MSTDADDEKNERMSLSRGSVRNGEESAQRPWSVVEQHDQSQRTKSVVGKRRVGVQVGVSHSEASKLRSAVVLTDKDIRIGRAFWKQHIDPQQSAYSMLLFRELFLAYPETEFFFLHMRDTGTDTTDVFTSPQFRNHMSERVVSKLKEILESLDNPEKLKDIMTTLGLYHAKIHLRKRHMDDMRKAILASANRIVGKGMLKEEEGALDRCFAKAFLIAQKTMDEYRKLHPERYGKY